MDLFTITEVTAESFADFLGLISKLAEYEKLQPPDHEAQQRLRRDCLSDKPKYKAYIGKLDDKAVAYIIYFFTYSSFLAQSTLYLEDIFVLQEYRRRGIGEKMFNFIRQIAKREGCGRIEFAVLKWNTSAQEFYKKNGAQRLEWDSYRITKDNF
jgi:GNAT superfamily N-acetyltransferase